MEVFGRYEAWDDYDYRVFKIELKKEFSLQQMTINSWYNEIFNLMSQMVRWNK